MRDITQGSVDTRELDLAAKVQIALLPAASCCIGGWQFEFSYEPAGYVSGDYVDLVDAGDGSFYFALGDVSGKGVAAALLMVHLNATLRSLLRQRRSIQDVVRETSRVFCENSLPAQFATLVFGSANSTGDVRLVNAGHVPLMLLGHNRAQAIAATGLPLGLFCSTDFSVTEMRVEPGEMLFLCSDGITEAEDAQGVEYGVERLQNTLSNVSGVSPHDLISAVKDDLRRYSKPGRASDDQTMLVLLFTGRRPGTPLSYSGRR